MSVEQTIENERAAGVVSVSPGSAARCPKCNGVGYHIRVRNFDTEDADVWECQSPLCTAYGLLWHTPRRKCELGEMRCALLALVEAEKASRDNFDGNAIERIERAMQRADRVLFPERHSPNIRGVADGRTSEPKSNP